MNVCEGLVCEACIAGSIYIAYSLEPPGPLIFILTLSPLLYVTWVRLGSHLITKMVEMISIVSANSADRNSVREYYPSTYRTRMVELVELDTDGTANAIRRYAMLFA